MKLKIHSLIDNLSFSVFGPEIFEFLGENFFWALFHCFLDLKRHSEVSRLSDQGLRTDDVYPGTRKLHILFPM